ncbi:hypothetical protein [Bacillus sp. SN10]|uniref:hypothetical protein n=1 Tax=Bacillus sp. SN10 TaxID=2056493 RepID=UPI000C32729C|nr:hypothetical protein [Bacillus sp. SN10]PKJ54657.1 hypothetical protein CWE34_13745 [Bacillus sp. SN10]
MKNYWTRVNILGCNNRLWINGESGAVYQSKIDNRRWMWRKNIIDAPDLDSVEKIIRVMGLQPEKHIRLFMGLTKKKR